MLDNYLFSGDTLLINGTGRTDFQNGNAKDAYYSIFNKLLKLPDETFLYPAHDYKGEKVIKVQGFPSIASHDIDISEAFNSRKGDLMKQLSK